MLHRPHSQKKKTSNFFRLILLKPGFGENHPRNKAWRNTVIVACVLRTETPGCHSTQTRTQASPAVAESEARLAIGFLLVDNSGPAAADSEFAASVMRQLRRPIRLCSRHMSRWMTTMKSRRTPPVCSYIAKERFVGWCMLGSTLQLLQSV